MAEESTAETLRGPDLLDTLKEFVFSFERLAAMAGEEVELGFETRGGGYHRSRYYPTLQDGVGTVLPSIIRGTVVSADPGRREARLSNPEGVEVTLVGWRPRFEARHYWPATDPPGGTDYLEVRVLTPWSLELILRFPLDRVYLGLAPANR